MYCVIGSGPSGVACARALLDRGATVHMVDGGVQLDAARAERVSAMRSQEPTAWSPQDLALIKAGTASTAGGIPLKLLYGSDFPYQEAEQQLRLARSGVGVQATLARGGFSNVWGAAMLPYADADLEGWPVDAARLGEHYRAAAAITGLSAVADDLAAWFPLHAEKPEALSPSRQALSLLGRMQVHRESLAARGLYFGRSRLAVHSSGGGVGCVRCGLCMYGCPYGLIYNSTATVAQLLEHPQFSYRPDFIVESLSEGDSTVTIAGRDRVGGAASTIVCERAYLAAGAIPSTQILLTSMGAYNRPVRLRDSQYYLIPLLLLRGTPGVREESLHTLSQLYLELRDERVSPYTVHLQVYTYNDLIGQVVRRALGPLARVLDRVGRELEGRLVVLQGYLHSAHSGSIRIELCASSAGAPTLQIIGESNPESRRVVRRVLGKLVRHAHHLGALPLMPLTKVAEPGRGFHVGGTFPMRQHPAGFETDVLGRPAGWRRLHVVDATVFPSIPATTITFTAMANAHRIAAESVGP